MIVNCAKCGSEFVTYPSKIKLGKGKYCSKACCLEITNKILESNGKKSRFLKGQVPHNFQGFYIKKGKNTNYKYLHNPDHPSCNKDGSVPEHRLIMESFVGRYLKNYEEVHHIDRNGLNNSINNLQLVTSAEHKIIHLKDTVHKRWQTEFSPA